MPFPPILKAMLHKLHDFPKWTVKLPLEEMDKEKLEEAIKEFSETQI
jgi:hypothetical protein